MTIKTPERCHWRRSGAFLVNSEHWRHSGVFIDNFEHISHLVLVFLMEQFREKVNLNVKIKFRSKH